MSLKTKAVSGSEQTRAGKLSDWQPDPVESGFSDKVSENRKREPKLTGAWLGKFCFTDIQLIGLKFKYIKL